MTTLLESLADKEFRDTFLQDQICTGLSVQIRAMREARRWTQEEFASRMDSHQSVVARLENPEKVGHSTLQTLLRVAATFDVALIVQFVGWTTFLMLTRDGWKDVPSFQIEAAQ